MKKIYFAVILIFALSSIKNISSAQTCAWAKKAGNSLEDWGASIAADGFGNVYTLGNFYSTTIVFGSTTLHNQSTNGGCEIFLTKYDSCGNFKWAKQIGGNYANVGKSVTTDGTGNVYITGYFNSDTLYFGTSSVKLINSSSYDVFVAKYDASGNPQWAQQGKGSAQDEGFSVATDASNNVIVSGSFASDTLSFGTTKVLNLLSGNNYDVFIAKFNSSGTIQWLHNGGGDYDSYGNGVGTDAAGNIYVTGTFGGSHLRFGTDSVALSGYYDIFLVKYDASGTEKWLRAAGDVDDDEALSIATDASGNSYITGFIGNSSTVSFGTHSITNANQSLALFVAKYDASGAGQWARIGQGDAYTFTYGRNIKLDATGNLNIIGMYDSDSLNFGALSVYNNSLLQGGGDTLYDIFVANYKPNGILSWARSAGGTLNDFGNGIAAGTHGGLYITGEFQSPSIIFSGITLSSANANGDVFIANNISTSTLNPEICLVTVDSLSQYNIIMWDKTPFAGVADTFFVYRDTANNNYAVIGKVPYASLSLFNDTLRSLYAANGDPNITSWRYKISVKDTSGNFSLLSPFHQTMYIQNNSGNFSWNNYMIEGQPVPVPSLSNYIFQRDNVSNGNYQTIATLSASSISYTDPQFTAYQNTAFWRVKTVWSLSCTATVINPKDLNVFATNLNSSKSNVYRSAGNTTAAGNLELENSIVVFPNPSAEIFTLTSAVKILSVEVLNTLGEKIYAETVSTSSQIKIDLSKENKGVYFVKIISANGTAVKKLMLQ